MKFKYAITLYSVNQMPVTCRGLYTIVIVLNNGSEMYMKQGPPEFTLVKFHILVRVPTLVEAEVIFLIFAELDC